MRRDARVEIRLSSDDKAAWLAKARRTGRSLSDLLREAIQRTRPWRPADRKMMQAKLFALARIGNNLNQVAKWANIYKSHAESLEVIAALLSLERELRMSTEEHRRAD